MRKNRTNSPSAGKNRSGRGAWLYKIPAAVFIISVCFYAVFALGKSGFFTIREIKIKGNRQIEIPGLLGRNIFCVDLRRPAVSAIRRYPQYCRIRVYRVLPDRIYVDFSERKPLACVKSERPMLVDEFGFLFRVPEGAQPVGDLPVIEGLGSKLKLSSSGKRQSLAQLQLALSVIKGFQAYPALAALRLKRVEIDGAGAVAGIEFKKDIPGEREIQVKFGSERISEKVGLLATIFGHYSGDPGEINYIDLRFSEPVIKYREDRSGSKRT
jgi:cell division septal protein FtsQ